ncbi:hypothetical protein HG536_0H00710 [Torulaspora globosa]|uniref:C3HC-type domain-containing protein n=1 Tax=Torulaspora globosa TaxID=48254 RepID=A0A7G3ZMG0_9SACH|nr:uncharacterized protein HG536_0H00710 [Torulaspora globosa]QLL34696.1 hypothetical protein HG536_0H00710 [Torulaspora globosa]
MDPDVSDRLEVVRRKLDVGECGTRRHKGWSPGSDEHARGILKKWRYRSRRVPEGRGSPWNRFLPRKLQRLTPLHDDLVELAVREWHGARLCNLQELLERCSGIQDGSRSVVVEWDAKWINPLSLASKGWEFSSSDHKGRMVCRCQSCRKTIVLDLRLEEASSEYLRQSYWVNGVSKGHSACCPWRNVQFDLEKEYYLHKSNLVHDIERIKKAVSKPCSASKAEKCPGTFPADQLTQLKKVFHYNGDDQLLSLLVRGYEPIGDAVVRCSACFRNAFLRNCSALNYHESWCRYREENKLAEMILSSLPLDLESCGKPDSVEKRLHNLETYLEEL